MFRKPTLEVSLQQLGLQVLDDDWLKAVMISKNEAGDVVITLVEGIEESHKVKFGRIDRQSRTLVPHSPERERRNVPNAQLGIGN
jgi:SOS-response transcriptional repressor LexA